jgi:hypothetical protein
VALFLTVTSIIMLLLYSLIILIFPLIVSINILIYRLIVRKALKRYIDPQLKEKGLSFISFKWPGLFSSGDFKNGTLKLTVMNKNGKVLNSVYAYIYYKDLSDIKRVTARIDTKFGVIDGITYSSEF